MILALDTISVAADRRRWSHGAVGNPPWSGRGRRPRRYRLDLCHWLMTGRDYRQR
jgi:hypothetical protein